MNVSDEVRGLTRRLLAVGEKQPGKDVLFALALTAGAVINQAPVDRLTREDMARTVFDILIDMINREERQ